MKQKKAAFGLLFLFAILFSVAGCGSSNKEEAVIEPLIAVKNEREIRFEQGSFIDYEELEREIGITGAFDLEEEVFSYILDGEKTLISLKGGSLFDGESGLDCAYRTEEGRVLIEAEPFLRSFGFRILSPEEREKERAAEAEAKDAEADESPETEGRRETRDASAEQGELSSAEGKLVMAWDSYVNNPSMQFAESLDVVIAKCFALQSGEGESKVLLGDAYIRNVKVQGKDLWIMATNSFDPDLTKRFLARYSARKRYIDKIVSFCEEKDIEGVSIDFENMYLDDSDLFVQFVAELYVELRRQGKHLGVCVTVPGGSDMWSKVFDRERLGKHSDYLMLMAYDQHWASSPVAGPVAAHSWVRHNAEKVAEMVGKDKVLLGLPFYTRVWYETYSSELPNKVNVRSKDLYMVGPPRLLSALKEGKYRRVWDADASQYFFVYYDEVEDRTVKFWFEDADSVARKALIANELGLPGVACWALGFETPETWEKLGQVKRGEYR